MLTITVGVPANPEGTVFGPAIATPLQLAFAGMVSVGALLAWKWDAAGAVLIAFAAAGLGIFAAFGLHRTAGILYRSWRCVHSF